MADIKNHLRESHANQKFIQFLPKLLGRIYNNPSRPSVRPFVRHPSVHHVTNSQSEVAINPICPSVKTLGSSLTLLLPAYYRLTAKRGVSKELSSNHNSKRKELVFGAHLGGKRACWKTVFIGTAVVYWLDYSSPTWENLVRFPAGSLPDPRMWESCWTMPLVGGFSRRCLVPLATTFRRSCILTIASQDLVWLITVLTSPSRQKKMTEWISKQRQNGVSVSLMSACRFYDWLQGALSGLPRLASMFLDADWRTAFRHSLANDVIWLDAKSVKKPRIYEAYKTSLAVGIQRVGQTARRRCRLRKLLSPVTRSSYFSSERWNVRAVSTGSTLPGRSSQHSTPARRSSCPEWNRVRRLPLDIRLVRHALQDLELIINNHLAHTGSFVPSGRVIMEFFFWRQTVNKDTVFYWSLLSLNAILLVKKTPAFPYWPAANQCSAELTVFQPNVLSYVTGCTSHRVDFREWKMNENSPLRVGRTPASKVTKRGSDTGHTNAHALAPHRSYARGVQCFRRDASVCLLHVRQVGAVTFSEDYPGYARVRGRVEKQVFEKCSAADGNLNHPASTKTPPRLGQISDGNPLREAVHGYRQPVRGMPRLVYGPSRMPITFSWVSLGFCETRLASGGNNGGGGGRLLTELVQITDNAVEEGERITKEAASGVAMDHAVRRERQLWRRGACAPPDRARPTESPPPRRRHRRPSRHLPGVPVPVASRRRDMIPATTPASRHRNLRADDTGDNNTRHHRHVAPTRKALNLRAMLPLLRFPVQMRYFSVGISELAKLQCTLNCLVPILENCCVKCGSGATRVRVRFSGLGSTNDFRDEKKKKDKRKKKRTYLQLVKRRIQFRVAGREKLRLRISTLINRSVEDRIAARERQPAPRQSHFLADCRVAAHQPSLRALITPLRLRSKLAARPAKSLDLRCGLCVINAGAMMWERGWSNCCMMGGRGGVPPPFFLHANQLRRREKTVLIEGATSTCPPDESLRHSFWKVGHCYSESESSDDVELSTERGYRPLELQSCALDRNQLVLFHTTKHAVLTYIQLTTQNLNYNEILLSILTILASCSDGSFANESFKTNDSLSRATRELLFFGDSNRFMNDESYGSAIRSARSARTATVRRLGRDNKTANPGGKKPTTSGIVRHDPHLRKFGSEPAGDRTPVRTWWESDSLTAQHTDQRKRLAIQFMCSYVLGLADPRGLFASVHRGILRHGHSELDIRSAGDPLKSCDYQLSSFCQARGESLFNRFFLCHAKTCTQIPQKKKKGSNETWGTKIFAPTQKTANDLEILPNEVGTVVTHRTRIREDPEYHFQYKHIKCTEEILVALSTGVLRDEEGEKEVNMERRRNEGAGKREIPDKTRWSAASSGTIPTCENPDTWGGARSVKGAMEPAKGAVGDMYNQKVGAASPGRGNGECHSFYAFISFLDLSNTLILLSLVGQSVNYNDDSFFSAFEAKRRGSVKGDTATRIKSPIAAKRKALNWRAVFSSCCVYL
ncbi:hypothetical protein PR048_030553 [Dryococelus australis]|uniref:Uncharacterized protein n=1 Tax=Dryococelus australis TaxID=614101 RepID=A0ABQ9GC00_9NEOP|nr:hypothetical protein PR048_030553 [Dryococelus australis]